MRFSELHLIRYGAFEHGQLNFPRASSDFHVVYGPNEAGKSTTMSAIADLLFGFPHVAAYDFRFDKLLLRVGGVVDGSNSSMTFRRKRGNARTFLDMREQPLDESPLTALLGGQTREGFLRAFSLDHTRLREGGRAILEAKDDIGQAIFAAGSGLVGVTRLVSALEEEAKAIWSERASATRTYYVAQRAHEDARARLRESQTKSAHWIDLKKTLDGHERELEALRTQRDASQSALQTTERRRRILTPIARRAYLRGELENLGKLPDLPPDAAATLELASRQISDSEVAGRLAGEQVGTARQQLAELHFDASLLGRRAQVTQLRAQQGAVDKALRDKPGLKAKAASVGEQLGYLLGEVGWPVVPAGDIQARLPGRPQVSELRALLDEHRALETARDGAAEEVSEQIALGSDLKRQIEALPAAAGRAGFSAVLQNVRAQGDLEGAVRSAEARHDRARRALESGLADLAPWRGTAQGLAVLPLASEVETYPLGEALSAAEGDRADADEALQKLREERDHRELRRSQLLRDRHAISSEMLHGARQARNATWGRLSAHLAGEMLLDAPGEAQQQFSRDLQEADDLADRRFDAARTSAFLMGLEQEIEKLDLSLEQAQAQVVASDAALAAARSLWSAATRVVAEAISPEGLKAWRAGRLRALGLSEAERSEAAETARLMRALEVARTELAGALPAQVAEAMPGASLAALLQAAADLERQSRQVHDEQTALQVRLRAAEEAGRRAETRCGDAGRRLEVWRGRWATAIAVAGFEPDCSLSLLRARLDLMDEIRSLADSVLGYEQRIRDIGSDVAAFNAAVKSLAADFQLAAPDGDPSAALTALETELEAVATLAERTEGLRERLKDAEAREAKALEGAEMGRSALQPLLAAANVHERAQLGVVIRQVQAAHELATQIEELTHSILGLGDGLDMESLLAEAAGGDTAELAGQSERLQELLRSLADEIERVAELRQAAYLQFKRVDDRPDAAIAASDLSQARAEMEVQAEAYVRKRAEAALLRWTMERYRREKQAPLLKRASGIFAELTLGSYAALGVDVESGGPRLSGVRADGATVVPVAHMSEGTIDQLFLALRLAAVEESVAAGINLPFLADDLFINYDDERSAAGFRVLARLAEHTQVLFFTHHEHLAELSRATLKGADLSICRLGELKMEAA